MATTQAIFAQLLNGLAYGLVLLLVSLGLTIIFGIMGIVNFAHGELYAIGAYVGYSAVQATGSFWAGIVVAPIVVGLLGIAMERTAIKRLYGSDPIFILLVTFGLAMIFEESIRVVWGPGSKPLSAPAPLSGALRLFGTAFPKYWAFVIVFTALVTLAAILGLQYTKYGMYIRAASRDSEMVGLLGINEKLVYAGVFGIGAALAGLSGIVIAPLRGISPGMGASIIIPAFVVVVIGGLGSVGGAIVGSILIGVLTTLSTLYIPSWSNMVMFVLMVVVLLVRPEGLMGEPGRIE